ncbi:MAG: hypothetical protein BHV62_03890 [Eggerthella sp. 51_9]|nr:MAG: hypothetical protein BHV62_03890 [Eggerthella sp. 51_9]
MLGTIVNTCCILLGSAIGSIAKRGLKPKYQEAIFTALGITTVGMGLNAVAQNMPHSSYPVLFIVSMAIGAIVGTALDLETRFKKAVSKHSKDGNEFAKGLSTAIMLFCVGTLSILGPVNSVLYGDETYLLTNATLDLVSSMVFGATFGFGIAIAAVVLFCWQSAIYLLAGALAPLMGDGMMTEIAIIGGLLILASGINLLKLKEISTMPYKWGPPRRSNYLSNQSYNRDKEQIVNHARRPPIPLLRPQD